MEYEYSTGGPRRNIQILDWPVSILYHKVSPREKEAPHSLLLSLEMTIFTKLHLVVDFCVFTSQVMYCMHKQWSLFYQGSFKISTELRFLKTN